MPTNYPLSKKYLIKYCGYVRLWDYYLLPKEGEYRIESHNNESVLIKFVSVKKTVFTAEAVLAFTDKGVVEGGDLIGDLIKMSKRDIIMPLEQFNVHKISKKEAKVLEVLYA